MGTALLKLTKGQKLGGRGQGRLTKDKAIRLQHYYRFAITADATPNIESMRTRIWATLFHCASMDDEPQHDRRPDGIDSWCFYKRAVAADEEPPCHADNMKHALAADVCKAMVPVYQRMSDTNLLKRLQKGQTQNSNECLHSVIWSRCSKTVFVGHRKLHGAVASAVGCFNEGATHLTRVMDLLAIESNEMTQAFVASRDAVRIAKSEQARKGSAKAAQRSPGSGKQTYVNANGLMPRHRKGQHTRLEDLTESMTLTVCQLLVIMGVTTLSMIISFHDFSIGHIGGGVFSCRVGLHGESMTYLQIT